MTEQTDKSLMIRNAIARQETAPNTKLTASGERGASRLVSQ
jgi:hypothetical protein